MGMCTCIIMCAHNVYGLMYIVLEAFELGQSYIWSQCKLVNICNSNEQHKVQDTARIPNVN